jgi:RNA polymerase sigma-70 factor (ECF subfamily)
MSIPLEFTRQAPDVSDACLVTRVLDGDLDAYAGLVRRHQEAIYRHVRGLGLDHDTSLDVVQDAFVKAFNHLGECREGASFKAWLFRICRNLGFDELRNVRRRTTISMSDLESSDAVEDSHTGSEDLHLTLREALDRVPVEMREAFLLKHDAGYTYEEIAKLTEASPSAVKMRVHRAREALRAFLQRQGFANLENGSDNRASAERLRSTEAMEHPARLPQANGTPVKPIRRMS